MHFREMPSPLRGKKVRFLDDLFVLPESRGTGVVDEMFKKLSKESAKNRWPFVCWITAEDIYRGQGVYEVFDLNIMLNLKAGKYLRTLLPN